MLYLYLCMLLVLPTVQFLYGISVKPVVYSIFIITFMMLLYVIWDYLKLKEKMKFLHDIKEHLTADKHNFVLPDDILEEEYQAIISSFYEIIQDHEEQLEKSYSSQVEYYTMWVHQIKTPISAMRLALQSSSTGEYKELLEQELFKIEQYVELALQYTKLQKLSNDLIIRDYPLEEIVNQSIRKYAKLFIYKKLSVNIEEFHAVVTTDSKWLSFLLEQLLSNSIKYTNQGGVSISCSGKTLTITDSGIGIREEDLERIFEKGYTGYNGRVDKKASGIGLYLAKRVADALAITIEITSRVGCGTTARITFPEDSVIFYESVTKM